MSIFAALVALSCSAPPTPSEVREDLDAHPWRPAPAKIAASETAATVIAKPAPDPVKPAPREAPAAPQPASGTGYWQLQLGALQSSDAAISEKKRLEKILGPGTVEILSEGTIHRLRYGNFASKLEAESARSVLKPKGVEGFPAQHP